MDPVKSLEEIASALEGTDPEQGRGRGKSRGKDGYRAIRVRDEVFAELEQWREMWSDLSLSDSLSRVMALARRELRNITEREKEIRQKIHNGP